MKKHKNKYKLTFLLLFVSSCGQMLSTQSMLDATFAPSPSISNALASQYNKLRVEFSQEMNVEGLSRGNSYSISQISNGLPLSILEVAILDSRTVQLTTEFQTSSATYLLTVTGVQNKIKANLAYPLNQKQFFGFNSSGGIYVDNRDGIIYYSGLNIYYSKCVAGQTYNPTTNDCTGAGNAGNSYLATTHNFCSTGNNNCNGGIDTGTITTPFIGGSTSGAYTVCNNLNSTPSSGFGGRQKWRVPKFEELSTLIQINSTPSINGTLFPNSPANTYWSATSVGINNTRGYVLDFSLGLATTQTKTFTFNVRCVSDP